MQRVITTFDIRFQLITDGPWDVTPEFEQTLLRELNVSADVNDMFLDDLQDRVNADIMEYEFTTTPEKETDNEY